MMGVQVGSYALCPADHDAGTALLPAATVAQLCMRGQGDSAVYLLACMLVLFQFTVVHGGW
jgi:hypothetical protein